MKDELEFWFDDGEPETQFRYPVSKNIAVMEWNDEDWEWPLRVTFFKGGTYEYDVANIPAFDDSNSGLTYSDTETELSNIWTMLKQGAKWSKEAAETGEFTRGSHGAAFDFFIKKPIGNNRALYRKVKQ
jgi:hypothetical protein